MDRNKIDRLDENWMGFSAPFALTLLNAQRIFSSFHKKWTFSCFCCILLNHKNLYNFCGQFSVWICNLLKRYGQWTEKDKNVKLDLQEGEILRSHELNLCFIFFPKPNYKQKEIKQKNNRKAKVYGKMQFILTNVMKMHASCAKRFNFTK